MPLDPKVIHRLTKPQGIQKNEFEPKIGDDLAIEMLKAQGMNIILHMKAYKFQTSLLSIKDTLFCIVDVETNGSKTAHHQIIEIGAVKFKNGEILDTYESLVRCDSISEQISDITGITVDQTREAPELKTVMQEFRLFLGDAVFVGHDAKFDYKFVSAMMERVGLGVLLNRQLCTIDLAERTFESERYGLKYLNELYDLHTDATHHRALSDAITTTKLLEQVLLMLPDTIHTTEELIAFSKEGKRMGRIKPQKEVEKG
jgi:DNA polymerase III subunit epsilon